MTLYLLFVGFVACFSFVLLFGAPYLPTHKKQAELAVILLQLKKGDTLYELGCGDGRILRYCAKRGVKGVGYELNPLIWCVAQLVTWRYRSLVVVHLGNFWKADLSKADGVYVFLLDKYMIRLHKKLSQEVRIGTRLASYTFQIPGKTPEVVKQGVYIYKY